MKERRAKSEERNRPEENGIGFRSSLFALRSSWPALTGYVALTLLLSWPVWWNLNEPVLGGDPSQNAWNLWWLAEVLTEPGYDLLYTNYIAWPEGTSLALHSLSQLNGFIALPLLPFLDILPTLRVLLLLSFPLSGWGMYLLARRYVQHFTPAFLAGCIFAFCPYRMTRFNLEQTDMVSTQWIPFYILCLLALMESRAWKTSWRAATGAGLFAALQALSAWYYAGFLVLFTFFAFVYKTIDKSLSWNDRRLQRGLILTGLIPVLLLSTTLLPMVRESVDPERGHADQVTVSRQNSSDLLSYLVPDGYFPSTLLKYTPLYLGWTHERCERIYTHFKGLRNEVTSFPGYGLLILIAIAAFNRDALRRFWLWSALVFFVLSLGPMLQIYGNESLPLPYVLVNTVPGLSIMRAPNRVTILFILSAAMVAALVLDRAMAGGRRWPPALMALTLLLEYPAVPIERQHPPPAVSSLIKTIADAPGEAVLHVPEALSASGAYAADWYMALQTLHGKRILGGYTSRIHWDQNNIRERYPAIARLEWESLLGTLPDPRTQVEFLGEYRLKDGDLDALPENLRELRIERILVHKQIFETCPATLTHLKYHFAKLFGEPLAEDELVAVYAVSGNDGNYEKDGSNGN